MSTLYTQIPVMHALRVQRLFISASQSTKAPLNHATRDPFPVPRSTHHDRCHRSDNPSPAAKIAHQSRPRSTECSDSGRKVELPDFSFLPCLKRYLTHCTVFVQPGELDPCYDLRMFFAQKAEIYELSPQIERKINKIFKKISKNSCQRKNPSL